MPRSPHTSRLDTQGISLSMYIPIYPPHHHAEREKVRGKGKPPPPPGPLLRRSGWDPRSCVLLRRVTYKNHGVKRPDPLTASRCICVRMWRARLKPEPILPVCPATWRDAIYPPIHPC